VLSDRELHIRVAPAEKAVWRSRVAAAQAREVVSALRRLAAFLEAPLPPDFVHLLGVLRTDLKSADPVDPRRR
jgi:uncharacterized protein (DUF885 family)